MRVQYCTTVLLLMISAATAQVVSHKPSAPKQQMGSQPSGANAQAADMQTVVPDGKPVARVNGSVLTNRDLVWEMYAIFPYGRQHNGFPKSMEPEIRKGAMEMIIFEELVYQEALRRQLTIPQARLNRAQAEFRKQFPNAQEFEMYLKVDCQGSPKVLQQRIRRSLLIEALLKAEVNAKSTVTTAQAKAYFLKNKKEFSHPESFSIQTISVIPPENATADNLKEAKKRADDMLKQAKATKTYQEFGLLAEKVSDDDWHVNMGDHKTVEAAVLPGPIAEAARKMKPGDVSELFHFGNNYSVFRLNAHTPAGVDDFEKVKTKLRSDLQKSRYNAARTALNQQLRKKAKVEVL